MVPTHGHRYAVLIEDVIVLLRDLSTGLFKGDSLAVLGRVWVEVGVDNGEIITC